MGLAGGSLKGFSGAGGDRRLAGRWLHGGRLETGYINRNSLNDTKGSNLIIVMLLLYSIYQQINIYALR